MTDRSVELRSDTFTRPTPEMRRAMAEAEVGDDVWNEDPTVHELERQAAQLMGKESALFVSSGTQGNLVALLSHTQRGDEIVIGDESHIFRYEAGGAAVVGALQTHQVSNGSDGHVSPADVKRALRGKDVHEPRTGCIALENTHNRCGGRVLSIEAMSGVRDVAHAHGVPVHLDGARIFNAAVALSLPTAQLANVVDSVTFCLSKGLGAPVGSVLCGQSDFIERGRRWRKMLGGGMRQAGVLAAAGLYALHNNVERLAEDHVNARTLAYGLSEVEGIAINPDHVETNIVFFDVSGLRMSPEQFAFDLAERGVRVSGGGTRFRAVTSSEVSAADIEYALQVVRDVVRSSTLAFA